MIFQKFFQRLVSDAVKSLPLSSLLGLKMANGGKSTQYYTRWVFACVNLISNNLAKTEWRLYEARKGGAVEVLDHKLLGLLYKFNEFTTKYDSLKLTFIHFLLEGKACWILERNNKNQIEKITVVPPSEIRVSKKDNNGDAVEYLYNKQEISKTNVLIFRNPDPSNPKEGRSHLSAVRDTVETDQRMVEWNKNLMERGAKPSVVVEIPAQLNANEQKLLGEQFNQQYGGFENANGVLVLANGAKISPFSIPPKDLEWIAGRGMNRDEILSIFGVPKILLGLEGQYNRATAETSELVFGKYTLDPLVTMITEQLNEFLVAQFGENLWLSFDSFAPEDGEMKLRKLIAGTNVWMTVNEARQEDGGRAPLNGGDTIYGSMVNVPVMTATEKKCGCGHDHKEENVVVLSKNEARRILVKVNARNQRLNTMNQNVADKIEEKLFKTKEKKVLKLKSAGRFDAATKEKLWREYVELKDKTADAWKTKLMTIFNKQGQAIIDKLESKKSIKKKLTAKDLMFDLEEEAKATMTIIEPQYYASLILGADNGVALINEPKINLADIPSVAKWTKIVAEKYSETITNTTYEAFSGLLSQSIGDGDSPAETAAKISNYLDTVSEARAMTIARTETARALTAGEAFAWESYGITKAEWYLAGSDPCEICQGNSNMDWSISEAEKGISEYSHPNCECTFLPK